jgi:hypothetical protein
LRVESVDHIRLGKRPFYDPLPLDEASAYAAAKEVMPRNAICQDAQEGMNA